MAEILGYNDTDKAIRNHVDSEDKKQDLDDQRQLPPKRRETHAAEVDLQFGLMNPAFMFFYVLLCDRTQTRDEEW